jgi:hypothetical protein
MGGESDWIQRTISSFSMTERQLREYSEGYLHQDGLERLMITETKKEKFLSKVSTAMISSIFQISYKADPRDS